MGFFKAYDMRGTFGVDFDLETAEKVGRALPNVVKGRRWLVGRDCRTTSEAVRDALARGLAASGAEVTDIGLATTPMVYFFTAEEDFDGSVMITASHNPPSDNGLKVSKKTSLPVGYSGGLDRVEKMVAKDSAPCGESRAPRAKSVDRVRLKKYIEWMKSRSSFGMKALNGLKIAIDCSNGMASLLAKKIFPKATLINDSMDGRFPAHSPNPLKPESRCEISKLVKEGGYDCGIIFDGDADRAMFVDEKGKFVQPDYLIPAVAGMTLVKKMSESHPDAGAAEALARMFGGSIKIIHDVRTSRGAIEAIKRLGATPVMVPVGHAFAKPILRKKKALCGGELAGHYYFSEFHGCDSGILAALRVVESLAVAKRKGVTFSQMVKPVSGIWANSGEINFKVSDKDAAIERVLESAASLAEETCRSTMDGYRLEYEEGWISIRKSNTEPYLRLIVETDTKKRLREWVETLSRAIDGGK